MNIWRTFRTHRNYWTTIAGTVGICLFLSGYYFVGPILFVILEIVFEGISKSQRAR